MEETRKGRRRGKQPKVVKLSGKRTVSRHVSGEPKGTEGAISLLKGRNLSGKKQRGNRGKSFISLFYFPEIL